MSALFHIVHRVLCRREADVSYREGGGNRARKLVYKACRSCNIDLSMPCCEVISAKNFPLISAHVSDSEGFLDALSELSVVDHARALVADQILVF